MGFNLGYEAGIRTCTWNARKSLEHDFHQYAVISNSKPRSQTIRSLYSRTLHFSPAPRKHPMPTSHSKFPIQPPELLSPEMAHVSPPLSNSLCLSGAHSGPDSDGVQSRWVSAASVFLDKCPPTPKWAGAFINNQGFSQALNFRTKSFTIVLHSPQQGPLKSFNTYVIEILDWLLGGKSVLLLATSVH